MVSKIFKAIGGIVSTLACFVFALILARSLVTGVKHAAYVQQIEDSEDYYAANYKFMGNCYAVPCSCDQEDETADDYRVDIKDLPTLVDECLALYPEELRSYISEEWTIVFAETMPEYISAHVLDLDVKAISAVSVSAIKTIFVYIKDEGSLRYVLTHEFAHALAYEYGCVDFSAKFTNLYENHKETYKENSPYAVPGYAVSSTSEFFAATVSAYVTEPDWLREAAPDVAEYIEELFSYLPYSNEFEKMFVEMHGASILKPEK